MTIYPSPRAALPLRALSITERVFEGLAHDPDRLALIDGPTGKGVTAAALRERITRLAGGLRARGIGPGTVVAILAPNSPDYCAAFHAVAYAGATVTTINPGYTAPEIAHQLRDSGAEVAIAQAALLPGLQANDLPLRAVYSVEPTAGHLSLDELLADPLPAQVPVDLDRDVVALPYSSGTTGLPKGVRLSHRNLVANVDQVLAGLRILPSEMTVGFLPFFHIYGMNTLMNVFLARGAGMVTMPRFDLAAFLGHIQTHRARLVLIAPPVAVALAKHPLVDNYDLSSLEVLMSGAAPLGGDVAAALGKRLGCVALQGYGMTELSPVSHICPEDDVRAGSVGPNLPNTDCRLVDPVTGTDAAPGAEGELWVRGPQVMMGYHNAPEATAATLTDGWLHTGDLGAYDADGHLSIRDRLKELIKVSGFQVAPAEVEAELLGHPDVADAAVIGLPDDESGERPLAFIVPAAGRSPDLDSIRAHLKSRLAAYKQPAALHIVDAIPKSASGKILRRVLKTQITGG